MKFTEFEVRRVGNHVVLKCTADGKLDLRVNIDLPGTADAEMYEALFNRLVQCAAVYEEVSDDVLQATITLMKGKQ